MQCGVVLAERGGSVLRLAHEVLQRLTSAIREEEQPGARLGRLALDRPRQRCDTAVSLHRECRVGVCRLGTAAAAAAAAAAAEVLAHGCDDGTLRVDGFLLQLHDGQAVSQCPALCARGLQTHGDARGRAALHRGTLLFLQLLIICVELAQPAPQCRSRTQDLLPQSTAQEHHRWCVCGLHGAISHIASTAGRRHSCRKIRLTAVRDGCDAGWRPTRILQLSVHEHDEHHGDAKERDEGPSHRLCHFPGNLIKIPHHRDSARPVRLVESWWVNVGSVSP